MGFATRIDTAIHQAISLGQTQPSPVKLGLGIYIIPLPQGVHGFAQRSY